MTAPVPAGEEAVSGERVDMVMLWYCIWRKEEKDARCERHACRLAALGVNSGKGSDGYLSKCTPGWGQPNSFLSWVQIMELETWQCGDCVPLSSTCNTTLLLLS